MEKLHLYNSLTRKKELFEPMNPPFVGMYVCGPTLYSDVHLGNCRTFLSYDLIFRYLKYLGYKVRYVRNITDVGHLEGDTDTGAEDKIAKKARLEALEPMEIVQRYELGFREIMGLLNILPPSIEPRATGHIIEQIEMIRAILENGYAYEENGSVYFDTVKFAREKEVYGKLSGRQIEDMIAASRDGLKNQNEKRHPADFALWVKAPKTHIMRWRSPWSEGFPGWHLECSAMSTKYLGKTFDIHGGGNDLKFPHHENEIAQNYGSYNCAPAKYWMHGNMLLMNGRKMSKSDGNTLSPEQLFTGESEHLTQAYAPMSVRFFMLQAHYRSTLDLTDEALRAADKAFQKVNDFYLLLKDYESSGFTADKIDTKAEATLKDFSPNCLSALNDDFNTAKVIAHIFEAMAIINRFPKGKYPLSQEIFEHFRTFFMHLFTDIMGLNPLIHQTNENTHLEAVLEWLTSLRQEARKNKDYALSDRIRDGLSTINIHLKDTANGTEWTIE